MGWEAQMISRYRPKLFLAFCGFVLLASAASAEPISRDKVFVMDGDTIIVTNDGNMQHYRDNEIRLLDFDTPEITRAKCPSEYERGIKAAARLLELISSGGQLDLTEAKCACRPEDFGGRRCNLGRRCGRLTVSGVDVGKTLIAEGYAVAFVCEGTKCPPEPSWCEGKPAKDKAPGRGAAGTK